MPDAIDLCYAPVSELLDLYRSKVVSPVDVLEAQIARYEEVNDRVNAVTYTHFDDARRAARESEQRYASGEPKALDGITVGVKDEHGLKGWTVTQGSRLLADERLAEDDPLSERLVQAGAVLSIQTTVPEFYLAAVTWTDLWGVTRNPWNLDYTVGGSSGGSAGALAAGMCTLATGSDMGGSIRIPAALNGLYGFKAPYGRVPQPSEPLLLIASSGPLGRSLDDIIRMTNVISGPHRNALTAIAPKLEVPRSYESIEGMRLAYSPNQSWAIVDAETRANTDAAVEELRRLGAVVDEVDLDLGITASDISDAFAESTLPGPLGEVLSSMGDRDQLTTYARYFAEKADSGYGPAEALKFQTSITTANRWLHQQVWDRGYDAMVMPTLATSHIPADHDYTTDETVIDGQQVHSLTGWILTPLFNLLYTYPVLSVPTGRTERGMPTGMQIVARPYDDLTTFRVASGYAPAAPPLFTGSEFPDFRGGD